MNAQLKSRKAGQALFVCPAFRMYTHFRRSGDGLLQLLEEGLERVLGDVLTNGVIRNSNGTFEVRLRVIGEQRAICLVLDGNLAGGIDGPACPSALHFENEQIGVLALGHIDNDAIGSLQTGQRCRDIRLDASRIEDLNRIAAGYAVLKDRRVDDRVEDLPAIGFELVCAVEFHEKPFLNEIHRVLAAQEDGSWRARGSIWRFPMLL